jgi:large subunit ribosomal protein L21
MYAIIEDSGVQFKVTSGDVIDIERPMEDHAKIVDARSITFDRVLLVAGDGSAKIGTPLLAGATVTAEVLDSIKDKKLVIEKYSRRKRSHVRKGHRQKYLRVKIGDIKA